MRIFLFLAVFSLCTFLTSDIAGAAQLVPCEGKSCGTCDVAKVINGLVNWLVVVMASIGGLVLMYAGVKMVTAAGNTGALESAKEMMVNIIVGYLILLSAWLVVDTVMKMLVGDEVPGYGPWNQIECSTSPEVTNRVQPVASSLTEGAVSVSGSCTVPTAGACSSAALSAFGASARQAAQICTAESGGNPASLSVTDRMRNEPGQPSFSIGLFQINLTVHQLVGCGPGGTTLNCNTAFQGRNYTATIVNRALYDQCVAAAQNPTCNTNNALRIYQSRGGSWRDWSTARQCGLQ